jgi:hypothetical protein
MCTTAYQQEIWEDLRATGVELPYRNPTQKTALKTGKNFTFSLYFMNRTF